MTCCTDKELLWRAFPAGMLPVKGTETIEGWLCVYTHQEQTDLNPEWKQGEIESRWYKGGTGRFGHIETVFVGEPGEDHDCYEEWKRGAFLPAVDRELTPTWGVLLANLAEMMEWSKSDIQMGVKFAPGYQYPPVPESMALRRKKKPVPVEVGYWLSVADGGHGKMTSKFLCFGTGTEEEKPPLDVTAEEALLHIRASALEWPLEDVEQASSDKLDEILADQR